MTTLTERVVAAPALTVEGSGDLAIRLRKALAAAGVSSKVLISAHDDATLPRLLEDRALAFAAGLRHLPIRVKGTTVEIGPLSELGTPGCAACAQTRHASVVQAAPMHVRLAEEGARVVLPPHWQELVCALVVERLTGADAARVGAAQVEADVVHVLSLPRAEVAVHHVTPAPECPHCDARPDDTEAAASWQPVPRPMDRPETLRVKPLLPLADMRPVLVDHRFGPVPHLFRESAAPMAMTSVELASLGRRPRAYGYGRSPDFDQAQRVGLLEAVERESGSWPLARRTTVLGSYAELAADALDPALLGLPDPEYDGHAFSLLDPYSPDTPTAWVWARELHRGAPILIPEHVAYYTVPSRPGRARYIYECSNGCAVGGCLEEAVLYGCLEVMERDAFLLSWYSQTPGTRLATAGLDDTTAGLLECLAGEGYEARLYDITTDNGMPVVWALALDLGNPDGASLSAAAAHPDPAAAVRGALAEVTTMAVFGNRRTDHPSADERRAMLADPALVRTIDDHVALHTLPEAVGQRLGWLVDAPGDPVPVAERFGAWRERWLRPDLTETLGLVVEAMTAAGTPPLAVRQTTARDERLGVEVVKVVAPGALAVTFGHVHHRTRGLPRLDRARAAAGVTGPVLPHPFP